MEPGCRGGRGPPARPVRDRGTAAPEGQEAPPAAALVGKATASRDRGSRGPRGASGWVGGPGRVEAARSSLRALSPGSPDKAPPLPRHPYSSPPNCSGSNNRQALGLFWLRGKGSDPNVACLAKLRSGLSSQTSRYVRRRPDTGISGPLGLADLKLS